MDSLPESVRNVLTNDQNTNLVLSELSLITSKIQANKDELIRLKQEQKRLIVKALSYDVSKVVLAGISGINRNTISGILAEYEHKRLVDTAFVNTPIPEEKQVGLTREEIESILESTQKPKPEELQTMLDKYVSDLKAEQDRTSVEPLEK